MNKILLILKREYLTRVRKKTFILSTILFPLLYLAVVFGLGYIGERTRAHMNVAVIDSTGYFDKGKIERANQADSNVILTLVNASKEAISRDYQKSGYDGFVVLPSQANWETGMPNVVFTSAKKIW